MNKILQNVFSLIILLNPFLFSSQEKKMFKELDSLKNEGYSELYKSYLFNKEHDSKKALFYANTYLRNAKKEGNKIKIAKGHKYVGSLQSDEIFIKHLDSAIAITQNGVNSIVSGFYYFEKGSVLYKKRDFKKSIDNLLIANKEARKYNHTSLIFSSNYMIAILTDRIGNHDDAIEILKEYPNYIKSKNIKKIDTTLYLNTYFALTVASYISKKIDSATYYNDIGIKKSLDWKNLDSYNHFLLSSGIILYHKNQLNKAVDSIEKAIKYFKTYNDYPNLAVSHFYKGKILFENEKEESGVIHLKKLDTIFQKQNDILPETREGYEILINHFKAENDIEQQLLYTERLIKVDKILNQNYRHLQTNIIKDYYTPLLISKKIENEKASSRKVIYTILSLLVMSLLGLINNYYRQKKYKRKYKSLLKTKNEAFSKKIEKNSLLKIDKLNISKEIIEKIIKGLDKFENEKKFTNSKYSLNTLAKELNTNSSYLSKIINLNKNKNFSNYINDLRIDYAIDQLKSNKTFRLYSIKSISEEVGFKNSESFSKIFYKKTGIYPSYFIKQINKETSLDS